jgi:hypothetical protein
VQQPPAPIIVKIVELPHDPTGLANVLLGAIGVAGVITLIAIVCGVLFAAGLFLIRRWRSA